jgi:hypothetical protein
MHLNHLHTPQRAQRVLLGFMILSRGRPQLQRKVVAFVTSIPFAPQMLPVSM